MADDRSDRAFPKSRLVRSARLGMRAGVEGARFAGAKAAGVVRSQGEAATSAWTSWRWTSAERLVDTLGAMKGVAMKMGQLASFIDTEYLPDEYRELYQDKLGGAAHLGAARCRGRRSARCSSEEYDEPYEELFEQIEPEAFAAASIGQVHRGDAARRPRGGGEDPVPGRRRGDPRRPLERRA